MAGADVVGVIRGPSGRLGRLDDPGTGPWKNEQPTWHGLVFDGGNEVKTNGDERYHFVRRAAVPDSLVSMHSGGIVGCDATIHSGGLDKQFYVKNDGNADKGWAETFQFYDGNANKAIQAVVEYAPGSGGDEGPFFSYALAFEVIG